MPEGRKITERWVEKSVELRERGGGGIEKEEEEETQRNGKRKRGR